MATIKEFDYSVDLLRAILWQYNDAENLISLVSKKQDWYNSNLSVFWSNWYNDVFNLDTANDFGLDVWAIILDVSFSQPQQQPRNDNVFGFGEFNNNFFESNFSPTIDGNTNNLSTEQKRLILKLTYLNYVSRGTVPEINHALTTAFGFKAYIIDSFDMTGNIAVLTQQVSQQTLDIIKEYDLIPRPAGVGVETRIIRRGTFGYGEFNENFYESNFAE